MFFTLMLCIPQITEKIKGLIESPYRRNAAEVFLKSKNRVDNRVLGNELGHGL